ncbi:NF-kappa-B inhibitor cactus-like [Rhagoletis pomonella]|uniref:NF-kappa-B inhibitor cactus-like n=1 Tax=Rhagoletis pomonella TaxID=28610 RepID=UPI00177C05CD|nr:NF-kappa-B inhibitor cactus-like [Rhagoletis pomonella]
MSSQNPAASKNTTNKNEKTDNVVGYDCSSASAVAASSESKESSQTKEILKNIDIDDQIHEIDSGFLSGPLSSNLEEEEKQRENTTNNLSKANSADKAAANSRKSPQNSYRQEEVEKELYVFDSGCIEEEEYQEPKDQSIGQHNTQSRQQKNSTAVATKNTTLPDTEMKLKHDLDAYISERFCNLSLHNEPINNLNASGRVATVEPIVATETTKTAKSNQLPAWEQYYQQNDEGDTYLHLACLSGQANIVSALIRLAVHPCLLNIKNDYGQTPLHLAVLTNQIGILRMLLLAGAEPNLRDCHGNTALHLACISGDEACVSALTLPFSAAEIMETHRKYGFRPNNKLSNNLEIRNYDGEFCVHLAAEAGHLKILSILVHCGADINAREGKGGYTPLHISIEKGNEEIFNFLLDQCKQKLDLETTTFGRLTAYQFACILKRSKMQNILEKHGVEPLTPPDSEYESSEDDSE